MNRFSILSLSTACLGVLFIFSMTGTSVAQDKQASVLNPKSDWSVKPMAASTDNGYCALSRQYDQDLILTLGQNKMKEYSFAIDFVKANLNPDRAYDVTLQPGPGQIRAYEMMPASARAMVIRLGYDDSFIKSLSESGELKAEIDGKNYTFNLSKFSKGHGSLEKCMASLGTTSPTKMASSGFEAKKIEAAPPLPMKAVPAPKVEVETAPSKAVKINKPVEKLEASTKSEVEKITALEAQKTPVTALKEAPRAPVIEINKVASNISKEVKDVRKADEVEIARLEAEKKVAELDAKSRAMAEKQAAVEKAKIEEERLAKQQAEKEKAEQLRLAEIAKQKKADQKAAELKAEAQRKAEDKIKVERLAKEQEEQKEQKRLADLEAKKALATKQKIEAEKAQQEAEAKMASLVGAPEVSSLTPSEPSSRPFENRYEVLETTNDEKAKEDKLNASDKNSRDTEAELAKSKARMNELEQENRALYLEARQARGAVDTAVVNTGNQALIKIKDYEKKLKAARLDNMELSKEIEELRRIKEDGALSAVAGDWDLEKSTKRYNEAEREIKRLGLLLEQQRLAHRQEKTELEQMLFDPAVTEEAQRGRLAELESKLSAAEQELQRAGRAMPASNKIANSSPYNQMPSMRAPSVPRAPLAERVDVVAGRQGGFPRIEDTPMAISSRQPEPKFVELTPPTSIQRPKSIPKPAVREREAVSRALETAPNAALMPVSAANVSESSSSFGKNDIQTILNKSGLGLSGAVRERKAGHYQWRAGKLAGHAEIVSQNQAGSLNAYTDQYIAEKKRQCSGDFASLPSPMVSNGKAFELACITPSSSMSSSLLFTQKGNDIIVIGHDIPAEDMDLAMDARDRIAESL